MDCNNLLQEYIAGKSSKEKSSRPKQLPTHELQVPLHSQNGDCLQFQRFYDVILFNLYFRKKW